MNFLIPINLFFSLTISFTIVYFMIPHIIKAAKMKNLFAVPNERSASKNIIPTLGGIAILAGFIISVIISSDSFSIDQVKYLIAAVITMFIVGLNDDILGSTAKRKLMLELPMALFLVILGNFRLTNFHGIFGINEINYFTGVIFSVIAIVGIINAFNLIDGIDGLAAGVGIIISVAYGIWFLRFGDFLFALTCFSLTGSLCAFFLFNVFGTTNKIFMGDTGSLIVGTIVSVLTIHFNEFFPSSDFPEHGLPAISLAIMIVPIIDTLRVFIIRIKHKKSPFSPDMNHIHHQLLQLTGSHLKASGVILVLNSLIILLAYNLIGLIGNYTLFILLLTLGFLLANLPSWILKFRALKVSGINNPQSGGELQQLKE